MYWDILTLRLNWRMSQHTLSQDLKIITQSNVSTINQAHFLRCLTDICLCVCVVMLPVMAFLSISALGFTCTRCGPATVRGAVN